MNGLDVHEDSGLSLVEVLVALAITAILTMAITWVLSTAIRVRDLSELTEKFDRAFIRLVGLSANLAQSNPYSVTVKGDGKVEFAYEGIGTQPYVALTELVQETDATGMSLHASGATLSEVTIDLTAFEAGVIQVFAQHETKREWRDADVWAPGTYADGVRLRLSAMSRTWFPMIWSRTRATRSVDQ